MILRIQLSPIEIVLSNSYSDCTANTRPVQLKDRPSTEVNPKINRLEIPSTSRDQDSDCHGPRALKD